MWGERKTLKPQDFCKNKIKFTYNLFVAYLTQFTKLMISITTDNLSLDMLLFYVLNDCIQFDDEYSAMLS